MKRTSLEWRPQIAKCNSDLSGIDELGSLKVLCIERIQRIFTSPTAIKVKVLEILTFLLWSGSSLEVNGMSSTWFNYFRRDQKLFSNPYSIQSLKVLEAERIRRSQLFSGYKRPACRVLIMISCFCRLLFFLTTFIELFLSIFCQKLYSRN